MKKYCLIFPHILFFVFLFKQSNEAKADILQELRDAVSYDMEFNYNKYADDEVVHGSDKLSLKLKKSINKAADLPNFDHYKNKADDGDSMAQGIVAWYYDIGWQTERNAALARDYAKKSSDQNNPIGLAMMGYLDSIVENQDLYNSPGVDLIARSIPGLIELAGESLEPHALAILGIVFSHGILVPKNKELGQACLRYSAESGLAPAQHQIALHAIDGFDMDIDASVFSSYAKRATALGYKPSIDLLEFSSRSDLKKLTEIVSEGTTKITNITSYTQELLRKNVGDPILLNRMAFAPIDTTIYQRKSTVIERDHNNNLREILVYHNPRKRVQTSKTEYIKKYSKDSSYPSEYQILTVHDLKVENFEKFAKFKKVLDLKNINPDILRRLSHELNDNNAQVVPINYSDELQSISTANGVIISQSEVNPGVFFIPASVIASAKSFSVVPREHPEVEITINYEEGKRLIIPLNVPYLFWSDDSTAANILDAVNEHIKLKNISILQKFIELTAVKPDSETTKFLGYSGIRIGMPEIECLEILRNMLNCHVETLSSGDIFIKNIENGKDEDRSSFNMMEKMTDFYLASDGGVIERPFVIAKVHSIGSQENESRDVSNDFFIFKEKRLFAIARYPSFSPKGSSYYNAILEKYGKPILSTSHHNTRSFHLMWIINDNIRKGDIFVLGHGKNLSHLSLLKNPNIPDRNRDSGLFTIGIDELDLSTAKPDNLSSLRCAYYWDNGLMERMKKSHGENKKNRLKMEEESKKSENNKIKDQF